MARKKPTGRDPEAFAGRNEYNLMLWGIPDDFRQGFCYLCNRKKLNFKNMQKRKFIVLFAALLGLAAFFTGCKYEEGPIISLRTKKERVANSWKVASAIEADGDDVTGAFEDHVLTFTKEGDFTWTGTWLFFSFTQTGEWLFTVDNENIQFQYDDTFVYPFTSLDEFQILKLMEEEMWIVDTDGELTEFRLVPSES
jgi:hypothetical protein